VALRQVGVLPDRIVLAMTYDDLREASVRDVLLKQLEPISRKNIANGGQGVAFLASLQTKQEKSQGPIQRNATAGTPQERLEGVLVSTLESWWPSYTARGKLLAKAEVTLRSTIARMTGNLMARRAAPIPPENRISNLQALDSFLSLAHMDGVPILIYKPPHRPGEKVFIPQPQAV